MKIVFDNLANFLSISPNQTPVFAVCLPGPSWTFLPFLFFSHPVLSPIYVHGGSDKSGIFFFILLNGTTQLKIIRFYWSKKKISRYTYWESTYSIKLPSAVKTTSILDLKLVQAFARVFLARDPITSFIFWIRSLDFLRDFALTHNSETLHKK